MQGGPARMQPGYSVVQGMSEGEAYLRILSRTLQAAENYLNEGHGFRVCVRTTSPGGTAESSPGR